MNSVKSQLISHASNRKNIRLRTYLFLLQLWCHIRPFILTYFPFLIQRRISSTLILHVCQFILSITYKYIAWPHFQVHHAFVRQHLISLGDLSQKNPYFLFGHKLHLGYPPTNISFIAIFHDNAVALLIERFYLMILHQIVMMGKLDQFLHYWLDPLYTLTLPEGAQFGD